MNIGLSLPVDYLAGKCETDVCRIYQDEFGLPDVLLEELPGIGVNCVEMRGVDASGETRSITLAACRIWNAGLSVTIHGCLPEIPVKGKFIDIFPGFSGITGDFRRSHSNTIITVHSYQGEGTAEINAANTVAAIQNIIEAVNNENISVKYAIELTRNRDAAAPGSSYSRLIGMIDEIGSEKAGICWDFGHTYSNVLGGSISSIIPENFLENVIHTHVHAIGPSGQTHWPLTMGSLPVEDYIKLLLQTGYKGVFNLELSPEKYMLERDKRQSALSSIAADIELIKKFQKNGT